MKGFEYIPLLDEDLSTCNKVFFLSVLSIDKYANLRIESDQDSSVIDTLSGARSGDIKYK